MYKNAQNSYVVAKQAVVPKGEMMNHHQDVPKNTGKSNGASAPRSGRNVDHLRGAITKGITTDPEYFGGQSSTHREPMLPGMPRSS